MGAFRRKRRRNLDTASVCALSSVIMNVSFLHSLIDRGLNL